MKINEFKSPSGIASAEFSECGTYRYVLKRRLPCVLRWVKPALFIMLNPSTADAINDDPTIRRCISFAMREQCTELTVVNLFALRATNPKELLEHEDPVGPFNDDIIKAKIEVNRLSWGIKVAAWGAHKFAEKRGKEIIEKFGPFKCLGFTKNGNPRHPLYVKTDQQLLNLENI